MNSENESEDDAMKMKGKVKLAVDIMMSLGLLFLMGYHLWGESLHEWVGAGMLVLFIVHHILNRNWYKTLFKGKYNAMRIVTLVTDFLVLVFMLVQMYSGIVMSRHVFAFLSVDGGMALARQLHILGAYGGFILMSLHLGLHWNTILGMFRKGARIKNSSKMRSIMACIAGLVIAGYGVWVFIKRDLLTCLLLKTEFVFLNYSESKILFYVDYIALMGLCIFATHYTASLCKRFQRIGRCKMRKKIALILAMLTFAGCLAGCGQQGTENQNTGSSTSSVADNSESDMPQNSEDSSMNGLNNERLSSDSSVVYFTSDISPEGLVAVYEKLGWNPTGKVAVKLSTGEPPASNYLRPELIRDLVNKVDGTIVECNTAYGGSRSQAAMHYQVAKDHGFTDIADFQILDEDGSMSLTVNGGSVLKENFVGQAFADYEEYLILSHFKGHAMAGYGGAIKNISIGLGSSEGKAWIHSGGTSRTNAWGGEQDAFLEAMAEAGKSVSDYLGNGERIVYVNVMNRLSVDCDCDGNPAEPDMHDIGILASTDPVALDQACIDLIYEQKDGDGASLVERIESRNGLHTLEHAEEIGLGSRSYQRIDINE